MVKRNALSDEVLKKLTETVCCLPKAKSLDLQLFGNQFNVRTVIKLIEELGSWNMKKLMLSFFEYFNQFLDPEYEELIEKFDNLDILYKKLIYFFYI